MSFSIGDFVVNSGYFVAESEQDTLDGFVDRPEFKKSFMGDGFFGNIGLAFFNPPKRRYTVFETSNPKRLNDYLNGDFGIERIYELPRNLVVISGIKMSDGRKREYSRVCYMNSRENAIMTYVAKLAKNPRDFIMEEFRRSPKKGNTLVGDIDVSLVLGYGMIGKLDGSFIDENEVFGENFTFFEVGPVLGPLHLNGLKIK